MSDNIKIEDGPQRVFSTGAESQNATGKGTPVLVPGDAIIDIAKHFEKGAAVYGARNWEKGIPLSEQLNSLERHLQQEKMGMTDEPHARALAWRAVCYLATKLRIENGLLPAELNDMPKYFPSEIFKTEEVKDEPAEDEMMSDFSTRGDGKEFCDRGSCCNRGFVKKISKLYHCPEHLSEGDE